MAELSGLAWLCTPCRDLSPCCGAPVTVLKLPVIPSEAMSQSKRSSKSHAAMSCSQAHKLMADSCRLRQFTTNTAASNLQA